MNQAQYAWYALMIAEDKKKGFEETLSMVDYHASFWNSEAVKKAKEYRESQTEEAAREAEEFLENVKQKEYKNNPLIEALKKIRKAPVEKEDQSLFSSINLNKLIKEGI